MLLKRLNYVKENISQIAQDITNNAKTAATISGATVGTGISTILEWLPENIGWIASSIGAVLSLVLIFTSIRRDMRDQARFNDERNK